MISLKQNTRICIHFILNVLLWRLKQLYLITQALLSVKCYELMFYKNLYSQLNQAISLTSRFDFCNTGINLGGLNSFRLAAGD